MFNGNVQYDDQEESGVDTLTDDEIINNSFNRNNVSTTKTNKILTKFLLRCNDPM